MRLFALEGGEDLKGEIWEMIEQAAQATIDELLPDGSSPESWDLAGLRRRILLDQLVLVSELPETNDVENELGREQVEDLVLDKLRDAYHRKIESLGPHAETVMSFVLLSVIDDKWKDHLYDLDHLKASINFRGWGQKDPLVEYKQEAYEMFVGLMADLRKTVAQYLFRAQIGPPPPPPRRPPQRLVYTGPTDAPGGDIAARAALAPRAPALEETAAAAVDEFGMARRTRSQERVAPVGIAGAVASGPDPRTLTTNRDEEKALKTPVSVVKEAGRNDPCPCGSGKKYKKCHGK
jgi:preprotein translocase subunit SecA